MSNGFDPFAMLGDVANEVGKAAQSVADGVGGAAQAVAGAVGDGVSAAAGAVSGVVDGALHPKEAEKEQVKLPPKYCRTMQRTPFLFAPKVILVRRVTPDAEGKPAEGRRQAIRLSKKGIFLLASDESWSPEVERLSISNCCVFKNGMEPGENPLLSAFLAVQSCIMSPSVSPLTGLIMFLGLTKETEKWYLLVLQHDGEEMLFRIGSKESADDLFEFLDSCMLPVPS